MRVVLDTNLLVRAAGERAGLGLDLVLLTTDAPHALLLSHSLYAEVRKVLHYPRLRQFSQNHGFRILRDTELIAELRGFGVR